MACKRGVERPYVHTNGRDSRSILRVRFSGPPGPAVHHPVRRAAFTALGVLGFALPLLAPACSEEPPKVGGLMLVVREDAPLGLDRLVIEVSARGTLLRRSDLRVPEDSALPTTLAIASNGERATAVSLSVSAYKGGAPVDRRDHVVEQVPTDRVATVDVVLSSRCASRVTLVGSEARSTCSPGETCNPASGACASATLNGAALPTFEAGDEDRPPKVEGGAVSSDASVPKDTGDGGAADGAPSADASKGGLVVCAGATEKRCANTCVSTLDPDYGCAASTCQRCDIDGSTVYSCVAGKCNIAACRSGYKFCGDRCVSVDDPAYGCGPTACNAATCPTVPSGQTKICEGGVCKLGTCSPTTKKCGNSCVPFLRRYGCASTSLCADCPVDESCQGTPSACGCTPDPVTACKDQECGPTVDNCGNPITCPDTCGPLAPCGGTKCGCIPDPPAVTCAGKDCGTTVGNCNQIVTCTNKACAEGLETCGAVTPNQCDLPPSCAGGGAGRTDCRGESCCLSILVPGGAFNRANSAGTPATISAVRVDKYKVTVARFRQFVTAVVAGWRPAQGAGKHTHLNGGRGLVLPAGAAPPHESGWSAPWSSLLAASASSWTTNLAGTFATYTPTPGASEARPVSNVTWPEAFAFCIWDGGFLPSFAELSFAWTHGEEQRDHPWAGSNLTTTEVDFCPSSLPDGGPGPACTAALPVGSKPAGDGFYGHADLAGGAYEWTADGYVGGTPDLPTPCVDCAGTIYTTAAITSQRAVFLGASSYTSSTDKTRASGYGSEFLSNRTVASFGHPYAGPLGLRCARRP